MGKIKNSIFEDHKKLLLLALGFILFGFAYYCVTHKKGMDFYTYFIATKAFHENIRAYLLDFEGFSRLAQMLKIDVYAAPYYYPPLTSQLILPLLWLPPKLAYFIWLLLSIMAIGVSTYLLTNGKNFLLALIITFGFFPTAITLYAGQVNAFLLLALCFSYYSVLKKRDIGAGLGIATGIMLKVIPVAHLLYFIWRGKIKITLAALVFLVAFFFISLPFVGLQGWTDFLAVVKNQGNPEFLKGIYSNQALSGFIARLVHNDLLALKIWRISAAVLVIATALVCWPRGDFYKIFALEFSLVTVAINLVMPNTWNHQNILLVIPILILVQRHHSHAYILWPLFLGYILTDLHEVLWHYTHNPVAASLPVFFALFLWVVLSQQIVRDKFMAPPQYDPPL